MFSSIYFSVLTSDFQKGTKHKLFSPNQRAQRLVCHASLPFTDHKIDLRSFPKHLIFEQANFYSYETILDSASFPGPLRYQLRAGLQQFSGANPETSLAWTALDGYYREAVGRYGGSDDFQQGRKRH
jgi:hypothetical protein